MLRFVSTNSPSALSSWNTCVPPPRLITITCTPVPYPPPAREINNAWSTFKEQHMYVPTYAVRLQAARNHQHRMAYMVMGVAGENAKVETGHRQLFFKDDDGISTKKAVRRSCGHTLFFRRHSTLFSIEKNYQSMSGRDFRQNNTTYRERPSFGWWVKNCGEYVSSRIVQGKLRRLQRFAITRIRAKVSSLSVYSTLLRQPCT